MRKPPGAGPRYQLARSRVPGQLTVIPIHRAARPVTDPVLPPVQSAFRALATTVVPEAAGLDGAGWSELERIVEEQLARRPEQLRRQFQLLVRLLQRLPVLRYGRPFTRLDARRRTRFLLAVQNAPLLLLRRGVWGLRVLVQMGYYCQPERAAGIGYRAAAEGWDARRNDAGRASGTSGGGPDGADGPGGQP